MTARWTTHDLPGRTFDPEPDDGDDGLYCSALTALALRQIEIHDQRGQGPGPRALWTAHTVPTQEYL